MSAPARVSLPNTADSVTLSTPSLHFGSKTPPSSEDLLSQLHSLIRLLTSNTVFKRWFTGWKKQVSASVDTLNDTLRKIGSEYRINQQNLYTPQTIEAFLEISPESVQPNDVLSAINLVTPKLNPTHLASVNRIFLTKGLNHPTPELREHFVKTLNTQPFPASLDRNLVLQAMSNRLDLETNPKVVAQLDKYILERASKDDLPHFMAGLHMPHPPVRQVSINVLNRHFQDAMMPQFLLAFEKETDPGIFNQLKTAITSHAKKEHGDLILASLSKTANREIQRTLLQTLSSFQNAAHFPNLFKAFSEEKASDLDDVYKRLLSKLVKKEHSPLLIEALKQDSERIQGISLSLMSGIKNQSMVAPLFEYLESPICHFADSALDILRYLGDGIDHPKLRQMLTSQKDGVRIIAAVGLTQIAQEEDYPVLLKALTSETNPKIAESLVDALASCAQFEKNVKPMESLLRETSHPLVRIAAVRGLKHQGFKAFNPLFSLFENLSDKTGIAKTDEPDTVESRKLRQELETTLSEILEESFKKALAPRKKPGGSSSTSGSEDLLAQLADSLNASQPQDAEEGLTPRWTEDDVLSTVIKTLNSSSEILQGKSLAIIDRAKSDVFIPQLFQYLEQNYSKLGNTAKKILMNMDLPHALLTDKLKSSNREVRSVAIQSLGATAEADLPVLMNAYAEETDAELEKFLYANIQTLTKGKGSYLLLTDTLEDTDSPKVKGLVAKLLVAHGLKAMDPLFSILTNADDKTPLKLIKDVEGAVLSLGKSDEALPLLIAQLKNKNPEAERVASLALCYFAEKWEKLKSDRKDLVYDDETVMAPLRLFAAHTNPVLKETANRALKVHVTAKIEKIESLGIRGGYEKETNFDMMDDLMRNAKEPEVRQAAKEAHEKLTERKKNHRYRRRY